jgi:hypothetical protein
LQKGADEQSPYQAFNLIAAQQGGDDDGSVEDRADEGGNGEPLKGVQRAGEDAGRLIKRTPPVWLGA